MVVADLEKLYAETLRDLLDAERSLLRFVKEMKRHASEPELLQMLEDRERIGPAHVRNVEHLLADYEPSTEGPGCEAMRGLTRESRRLLRRTRGEALVDLVLLGGLQRAMHYLLAGYAIACGHAARLARRSDLRVLKLRLEDERLLDYRAARLADLVAARAP